MASMNNNVKFIDSLTPEMNIFVDAEEKPNSISNPKNARNLPNNIVVQTNNYSISQNIKFYWWFILDFIPKPIFVLPMITSVATIIGILVVCLTTPNPPSPKCVYTLNRVAQLSSPDSSNPQSVAVGDFNNDGRMDIVVANTGTDNMGVFLLYDNGTFASQVTYPTGYGSAPHMVVVGDFNNDHQLDIAVANFGTNNIGILLGNGDGSFTNQTSIETKPSHPLCLAVGDFNNDKQLDITIANYGTNSIGVHLGFGNASFIKQITLSTGYDSLPYAVAVGDFNNDDKLDIVFANFGTHNVGIFLGYGNGTFIIQTTHATGTNSHPYFIAIADLNNDGQLDIAVVTSGTDSLCLFFGYGNGNFTQPTFYSTGLNSNPVFIAIADFNDDRIADIMVVNNGTSNVGVFFGYANGTFARQIICSTGPQSSPRSIGVADFNNDNKLDIAIADKQNNYVRIFYGFSNVTFASQITYPSSAAYIPVGILLYPTGDGSQPYSIALGDFNNDSRLDIAVANYGTSNVGVLLGYGDGSFSNQVIYPTGINSRPSAVAVGDFNNDSRLDIAVANYDTSNVGVFLGYGNGSFSNQMIRTTGNSSGPIALAINDFNNDGRLDIAVANYGTSNVGVFLGYGNGTLVTQIIFPTGNNSGPGAIAVYDFNKDGRQDIAVANYKGQNVGVFLGYGNGNFSSQSIYPTGIGSYPYWLAVGDFNNDSVQDIAVVNNRKSNLGVFLGYGNGSFSSQMTYTTGDSSLPTSLVIGDFNNDTRLDVVVANYGTNNVGVLLGCGNGTFPLITYQYRNDSYPTWVAIGDFNNDSRLDIAVANSGMDNVGILLGYGNGTFTSSVTYPTGTNSGPVAIALGDFNNDARLDIAVANYGTNNIGVFLGYGNGTLSSHAIYPTGDNSHPISVAVGDFNSDSILDIAVANYGIDKIGVLLGYGDGTFVSQMTYPTGDVSKPISVAIGDFNNDIQLDIAVVNSNWNSVGIILGYGNGSFASQTDFSAGVYSSVRSLALGDFNNDSHLDIVVTNANKDQEHISIFLGNGNGTFLSHGKYKTGIGSIPFSVVIGQFNNDSHLDIAVGNRGTNNVGIFIGYGDGTFSKQAVYPTNDGSNAISIAAGDFNGDNQTDVVVANYGTFTIGVFLAISNTNFENKTTCYTGSSARPAAISLGDFTNDGQLGVAVANYGTHNIDVLFLYGNGSFLMQTTYVEDFTFYPASIVVTDFNNDSQLDIAVANSIIDNIILLYGQRSGTFGNQTTYATGIGSNPQSVISGDLNNDHRPDIVISNSGTGSVGVLLRADNGAFGTVITFSTGFGSKPQSVAVGDFDNNGLLDIAVAHNGLANVGLFFGSGNGTFSSQRTYSLGSGFFPVWIGVGDFNSDSRLDITTIDNIGHRIAVLLGSANGSFENKMTYLNRLLGWATIGDFNNDSRLDVAVCQNDDNTIIVLIGNGDGTFSNQMIYSTGNGSWPNALAVGDFNNDNRLDIVVANGHTNNVGILLGYGDGTFENQMTHSTGIGSSPYSVAVGDFNNDSHMDIVVANYGTNNVGILLGYGNGAFSIQTTYATGDASGPWWVSIGDFNQDHLVDIVVANSGTNNIGVLLGYVNGTFFNEITYSTGNNSNPVSVAIGDLNKDGRLDITVCNILTENIGVFLGYANEGFVSIAAYRIGESSEPEGIAVGDFNNDTHLDVVVADRGKNEMIILYGSGYGTFLSQANYSTGGNSYPNSVAVGDFNQDHQLDVAIINSGPNSIGIFLGNWNGTFSSITTYFIKDFSSLRSLTIGLFDNDTALDLAVANYGANNIAILLGYGNGSFASPIFFTSGFGSHPSALTFGYSNIHNTTDIFVCNSGYSTIDVLSKTC
ncbi:unnamed protein product [Rotaria magnacalcarata]